MFTKVNPMNAGRLQLRITISNDIVPNQNYILRVTGSQSLPRSIWESPTLSLDCSYPFVENCLHFFFSVTLVVEGDAKSELIIPRMRATRPIVAVSVSQIEQVHALSPPSFHTELQGLTIWVFSLR